MKIKTFIKANYFGDPCSFGYRPECGRSVLEVWNLLEGLVYDDCDEIALTSDLSGYLRLYKETAHSISIFSGE
jgi:hypothetical protein